MRPQAGGGELKHAPPIRLNDLPVVARAAPPANFIFPQLLTAGGTGSWLTHGIDTAAICARAGNRGDV
jgi:hypothetical protein